jgi:hypothetical protein
MNNAFDLSDTDAYLRWRDRKLRLGPARATDLVVEIVDPTEPSRAEIGRLAANLKDFNLSLFACADPAAFGRRELLELGRRLGLRRLDGNLCADEQAVSTLRVRAGRPEGEYVPYTNRPLSWHTDGYYNPPDRQVRAWVLYCVQDALEGGENALLDHEIAYIRLRDEDPELIRALMDPQALTIPANVGETGELRPASTGPVFSVKGGFLHMRYTARKRNAAWREDPKTRAARDALARLFSSDDVYISRHKLAPGEGYVSNNLLHNRTGYRDSGGGRPGRTLLRMRYLDHTSPDPGTS